MAKQTFTSGQTLLASQMNSLQANDYNWTVSTQTANYTLQAADKGTREVMNMASAGTVTVPNATFDAGDIVWVHSIGSGTISVVAGSGMTLNSSAGTAPTLAQWEGGVVYFTSASSSIFFRGGGAVTHGVATGGTSSSITVDGVNYTLLTFTSTGTLTVTKAGVFDILMIGGGGGGGFGGAGGGGGGYTLFKQVSFSTNQTVTVGGGGSAGGFNSNGGIGTTSSVSPVYSCLGGGGGQGIDNSTGNPLTAPAAGSTAGGATSGAAAITSLYGGTQSTTTFEYGGFNGGRSNSTTNPVRSGGGGGATSVGLDHVSGSTVGGNGGNGYDVSLFIGGSTSKRGGGGGGNSGNSGTAGTGTDGGGNGGNAFGVTGGNGTANFGGGGGGGGTTVGSGSSNGGAGGAGIVYVRFRV